MAATIWERSHTSVDTRDASPSRSWERSRECGSHPWPLRAASLTRLDLTYSPYLYVLPFFVIFAWFSAYPIAYTVWIALTDRSPLNPTISFVGLDNFVELITDDPQFWNAVVNTFGMFLLSTVPLLLAWPTP